MIILEKQLVGVNERIVDHTGKGINFHLLKHSIEIGHKPLEAVDYKVNGRNIVIIP